MSVEVQEEQTETNISSDPSQTEEKKSSKAKTDTSEQPSKGQSAKPSTPRLSLKERIQAIEWRELQWKETLLTALFMAIGWCLLFVAKGWVQFMAGIVPVSAGLFLGRRLKNNAMVHGIVLGVSGFLLGFVFVSLYSVIGGTGLVPMPELVFDPQKAPVAASPTDLIAYYVSFSLFAMIPFPAFGTVISYRNEQRRKELDAQLANRGGQLEKAGTIRTLEDLQGLSLPQFGTYVRNLYTRNGFAYKDYRFIDKDKHLDLYLEYQEETYLLRLSVADKVRPGTIETLVQDMKRKQISKGVVITSTEFQSDVKERPHIRLIDGQTLFQMAENRS